MIASWKFSLTTSRYLMLFDDVTCQLIHVGCVVTSHKMDQCDWWPLTNRWLVTDRFARSGHVELSNTWQILLFTRDCTPRTCLIQISWALESLMLSVKSVGLSRQSNDDAEKKSAPTTTRIVAKAPSMRTVRVGSDSGNVNSLAQQHHYSICMSHVGRSPSTRLRDVEVIINPDLYEPWTSGQATQTRSTSEGILDVWWQ